MVSVSGLCHHCIYAVGCGCVLKVCQRYKRALALATAVSLSSKLKDTVVWTCIHFHGSVALYYIGSA